MLILRKDKILVILGVHNVQYGGSYQKTSRNPKKKPPRTLRREGGIAVVFLRGARLGARRAVSP